VIKNSLRDSLLTIRIRNSIAQSVVQQRAAGMTVWADTRANERVYVPVYQLVSNNLFTPVYRAILNEVHPNFKPEEQDV